MSRLGQAFRKISGAVYRAQPTHASPAERRVSKRLPVQLEGREMTTTNISQSGTQLQVSCPQSWLPSLQQTWDPTATTVQITLPSNDLMSFECSVAYVSECEDEYLIGLKFNDPADAQHEPWQSYLAQLYGADGTEGAANAA